MRKILSALAAVLLPAAFLFAQDVPTGGVKGRVLSKADRTPIGHASIRIMDGAALLSEVRTDEQGRFLLPEVDDGSYTLVFLATGYLENRMPVMVSDGKVKNVFNVALSSVNHASEAYPGAFQGSTDIYENLSAYLGMQHAFSSREYSLAGVLLEDDASFAQTYLLPEGLRENRFTAGAGLPEDGFGGLQGSVGIDGTAGSFRSRFRASLGSDRSLYGLQASASYGSGPIGGGWTLAAEVSGRAWEKMGASPFSLYLGAQKAFSPSHKLNAAVLRSAEPVSFLRYDYTPSARFHLYTTALGRFSALGGASLATGFTWRATRRFTLTGGADGLLGLRDRRDARRIYVWAGTRFAFGRLGLDAGLRLGDRYDPLGQLPGGFSVAAKAGVNYWLGKSLQASVNAACSRPGTGVSPTLSADANLTVNSNGIHLRSTVFHLSTLGSGQPAWGGELAFKSPVFVVPNLFAQGLVTAMTGTPVSFYGAVSWTPRQWFVDAGVLRQSRIWMADVSAGKTWLLEKGYLLGFSLGLRPLFEDFVGSRYMARVFVRI